MVHVAARIHSTNERASGVRAPSERVFLSVLAHGPIPHRHELELTAHIDGDDLVLTVLSSDTGRRRLVPIRFTAGGAAGVDLEHLISP